MKFRLTKRTPTCTTLDHIFRSTAQGAYCYCEQRRWGIEPPRRQHHWLDEDGHVHRQVRRVLSRHAPNAYHPRWVFILALKGCGHLKVKTASARTTLWTHVRFRCAMCERVFRELQDESDRAAAQRERKRQQEMKWIRLQMARKRLIVKVKKHRQILIKRQRRS